MKKQYINPTVEVIKIAPQSLLADSQNLGGNRGDYSSSKVTTASRQSNGFWDEEE